MKGTHRCEVLLPFFDAKAIGNDIDDGNLFADAPDGLISTSFSAPGAAMSYIHLTLCERETIAQMYFSGHGPTAIGRTLGRSPGTISREISRNGSGGRYRTHAAHQRAMSRRTEQLGLAPLLSEVQRMLSCCLSPDEVSGRLKFEHPDDSCMLISHREFSAP